MNQKISAIDLFCGAGGLTHGLIKEGIDVRVGVDLDPTCRYPYEFNNGIDCLIRNVTDLSGDDLAPYYPTESIRLLAGCAPCQPFSTYSYRYKKEQSEPEKEEISDGTKGDDERWGLLYSFSQLADELRPELITMENVSLLERHNVFADFVGSLEDLGYTVSYYPRVNCTDYDIPQMRIRLVLFASVYGKVDLCPAFTKQAKKVEDAISDLPVIEAGEICPTDPLHRARNLSELNLRRIRASTQGGSWRDWDESLITECHKKKQGHSYGSVYGRMSWNRPSPTITTEFYGYGSGRFGHPDQDRAISLREGAILQTFPSDYAFVPSTKQFSFDKIGRLIGNAVPVNLGRAIGRSIIQHLEKYNVRYDPLQNDSESERLEPLRTESLQ